MKSQKIKFGATVLYDGQKYKFICYNDDGSLMIQRLGTTMNSQPIAVPASEIQIFLPEGKSSYNGEILNG